LRGENTAISCRNLNRYYEFFPLGGKSKRVSRLEKEAD